MVWINKVKEMLGIKSVRPYEFEEQDTLVLTPDDQVTSKEKIEKASVKTNPVTVKHKNHTTQSHKRETRKSLEKMTKVKIDELAQERFGVELDRRRTKEIMIDEFLTAQKKAK